MEIANRLAAIKKGAVMPFPQSVKAAVLPRSERWTIDWIDVWAFSLGAIALSLAALIYFADRDPVAVSFVLVAFAAIIGVVLRESVRKREQD
jgi:hypothetical protein